jgi:hypothetical protein
MLFQPFKKTQDNILPVLCVLQINKYEMESLLGQHF